MTAALALVETRGQLALTTSVIIADGCGVTHQAALRLIRKYQEQFRKFGRVDFEIRPFATKGGTQEREVALLNEDHATFLITLFRNTPAVVEFKVRLVLEFRKALNEISRLYANPPRRELLTDKRRAGRAMTDILQETRADAGKDTQSHHYTNEHKLCNWALTGTFAPLDESLLSNAELEVLRRIRAHNTSLIDAGLDYAVRKPRLSTFAIRARTKLLTQERAE